MAVPPPDPSGQASHAGKLKGTISLKETAKRSAKKAFIEGVDSKVIGTSAMVNGRQTIFVSKEEDDYMAAPYQYSLVGKFSHGYPTMTRLLLKWTSEFDPTEESPIMPVWIKVSRLRPHWFHRQFLYHVASLIGNPLKLDEATIEIANPMFARHTTAACFERNEKDEEEGEGKINMDKESQSVKEVDLREILQRKRGKEPMIGQDNGSKGGVVKEKYFTTSSSKNDVGTSKSNRKYIQKDNTLNSDDETSKNIQDSPRIDPKNPSSLDNIGCYKEIERVRRERDLAITESMEGEDLNNQLVLLGTEVMAPKMIESEDVGAPDNSENPWEERLISIWSGEEGLIPKEMKFFAYDMKILYVIFSKIVGWLYKVSLSVHKACALLGILHLSYLFYFDFVIISDRLYVI
ncbi:hypothetical protein BUALT_Bualt03G0214600 [Buddleja alternifolia]|uniref:DUF4283 domain-containing protein n=1 Tax=Buddleja alternifolia TaxID=168488 RepID=A0AAV6Y004_9LAMI|nr:hypothetical protein BUALT_Bualt03G0214600 [Buddleja alternifolia]